MQLKKEVNIFGEEHFKVLFTLQLCYKRSRANFIAWIFLPEYRRIRLNKGSDEK